MCLELYRLRRTRLVSRQQCASQSVGSLCYSVSLTEETNALKLLSFCKNQTLLNLE